MRSWTSRSFKKVLGRRLVLSSCHHQLDVSVPRCDMQYSKYVVQHPNVAFGVEEVREEK